MSPDRSRLPQLFGLLALCIAILVFSSMPTYAQEAMPTPAASEETSVDTDLAAEAEQVAEVPVVYTQVAVGSEHTCALATDGVVRCWGSNTDGQLADGSNTTRSVPLAVSVAITDVISIAAGGRGSLALTEEGTIWTWGQVPQVPHYLDPTLFGELDGPIEQVALSYSHLCALIEGEVFCYGGNWEGALGDGTTDFRETPVKVTALDEPVTRIAAGGSYSCALMESGDVMCWGANWFGNLGNGTTEGSPTPVQAGLSGAAVDIQANDTFACAVMARGGVECWGAMEFLYTSPTVVAGVVTPVDKLVLGDKSACALSNGALQCWGENTFGQLGVAASEPVWRAGAPVALPADVTDISIGNTHACAVLADGSIHCWGSDQRGQLGRDRAVARQYPVAVAQTLTATVVSVGGTVYGGESHTCAIFGAEGALQCWGGNGFGQIGLGEEVKAANRPTVVPGLESGVVDVALGRAHGCAVTEAGDVYCWGEGWRGQLGNGEQEPLPVPVQVQGLGGTATALVSGQEYSCVLLDDGSVRCWGAIAPSVVNERDSNYVLSPVTPQGLDAGVVELFGGGGHACAIMESGDVQCWGNNFYGQTGNGEESRELAAPSTVPLAETPVSLALGENYSCALTADGETQCWGRDSSIWMLIHHQTSTVLTPTVVAASLPSDIIRLEAGEGAFCAITDAGGLSCLEAGFAAALGVDENLVVGERETQFVTGLEAGVAAVALGESHSCAILEDSSLWCWGSDGDGELGVGVAGRTGDPAPVASAPTSLALRNHAHAAPDSVLRLSAFDLPPSAAVTVLANGVALTTTTPLISSRAGAAAIFIDTSGAEDGYYRIELVAASALTGTAPITTGVDLILTDTAPLNPQQGAGLPVASLAGVEALEPPVASEPVILLSIRAGANIRTSPNGEILREAGADAWLVYDAATANGIDGAEEVAVAGADGDVVLLGARAGQYVWVPVLVDDVIAWVGNIVIEGVSVE